MKKTLMSAFVLGLLCLNFTMITPASASEDPNKVTCYSTYTSSGNTTITKCNGCVEQSGVDNYSDEGTCRP